MNLSRETDYLDELVTKAKLQVDGFAEAWAPVEVMHDLVSLRTTLGLTQEQVAERMHVARPRVAEMEKNPGRVSFARIVAYSNAVGGRLSVVRESIAPYEAKPKKSKPPRGA